LPLISEETGNLTDVAVRPSWQEVETLFNAVKDIPQVGPIRVYWSPALPKVWSCLNHGLSEIVEESKGTQTMEYKHE
jgi:hypothetical protein